MEASEFFMLIEQLTGTAIKDVGENDKRDLAKALRDDGRRVDWTQFNELLLLVNKDRVEAPFFERYFRPSCMVAEISAGVTRFQKDAMRRYGNFIFAYRKLSKMPTRKALESELGELCVAPHDLEVELKGRSPKLLEIEPIDRGDTYLVGYLSAEQITTENSYADLLLEHSSLSDTWDALDKLNDSCREDARPYVCAVVEKYRSRNPQSGPDDFAAWLKETRPHLESLDKQLEVVQYRALRNQDVYLTWDHMDVYFATSMRKRDEYEDLYDFVNKLMAVERLAELNIRYFDPTQSFTPNRVDKGLVEALMLRRAKCTVYSIQDTDTLGKDSELASTLAQGKPVIAYVPRVDIAARAELLRQAIEGTPQPDLLRRPRRKASLQATWKPIDKISLSASVVRVSGWIDGTRDFSIPRFKAPGYMLVNVASSYEFAEGVTATARVDNLFNKQYQSPTGFRAPGMAAYAGLRVTY